MKRTTQHPTETTSRQMAVVVTQPTPTTPGTGLSRWHTTFSHFVDTLDIKESSLNLYERTLRLFFEWVNEAGKDPTTLTRSDILEYRSDLFSRGLSSLTIASYLTSLRKYFEWAEGERIHANIMKGVKTPKRVQAFKKLHLTDEKSQELLEHFRDLSLRDFAICNLALRTGLRTIEIVRADVGDITFVANKRVLKVWGKGHDTKDDFVVLTDKTYKPIKDYLATRKNVKDNDPLFTSDSHRNTGERLTTQTISKLCKSGLRAIGLDGREFTAHSLRHTAGVAILNHGGTITDAQHLLRHTSPETTQIYVESIKRDLRLRNSPEEIIDKAF